jgi:hypothetical protein
MTPEQASRIAGLLHGLLARQEIEELIERSSFGTPAAKAIRARCPPEARERAPADHPGARNRLNSELFKVHVLCEHIQGGGVKVEVSGVSERRRPAITNLQDRVL